MHHPTFEPIHFTQFSEFKPIQIQIPSYTDNFVIRPKPSIPPKSVESIEEEDNEKIVITRSVSVGPISLNPISELRLGHLYGFPETFKTDDVRDCYIVYVSTQHNCKFTEREILTKTEVLTKVKHGHNVVFRYYLGTET